MMLLRLQHASVVVSSALPLFSCLMKPKGLMIYLFTIAAEGLRVYLPSRLARTRL